MFNKRTARKIWKRLQTGIAEEVCFSYDETPTLVKGVFIRAIPSSRFYEVEFFTTNNKNMTQHKEYWRAPDYATWNAIYVICRKATYYRTWSFHNA